MERTQRKLGNSELSSHSNFIKSRTSSSISQSGTIVFPTHSPAHAIIHKFWPTLCWCSPQLPLISLIHCWTHFFSSTGEIAAATSEKEASIEMIAELVLSLPAGYWPEVMKEN